MMSASAQSMADFYIKKQVEIQVIFDVDYKYEVFIFCCSFDLFHRIAGDLFD
jgi:hypothetical protein